MNFEYKDVMHIKKKLHNNFKKNDDGTDKGNNVCASHCYDK